MSNDSPLNKSSTRKILLPNGKTLEVPLSMSPQDVEAILNQVKTEVPKHTTFGKKKPAQTLKEEAPEIVGSIVGSLAGSPAGIPGMVGGAMIGGAAGKAYQDLYYALTGDKRASKTSSEASERIGEAGLAQGLMEGIGGTITGVGGKILKPYASKIGGKTKEAIALLDKYMPRIDTWKQPVSTVLKKKVPSVLPTEAHRGYITGLLHDVAEGSIWGGRTIRNYKEVVRTKAVDEMFDDFLGSLSGKISPDDLGELIGTTLTARFKDLKDTYTTPLYNKVGEMVGDDVLFSVQPLRDAVVKQFKTMKHFKGFMAEESGDNIVNLVMQMDDEITFDVARSLRTRLRVAAAKAATSDKKAPAIGIAKRLENELNKVMTNVLKKENKEAHVVWRNANQIYKQLNERYNDDFARKLIKMGESMSPQKVMGRVVEKANPRTIDRMKRVLDPKAFSNIRRWAFEDALQRAPKNAGGELNAMTLEKAFFGRHGMSEQVVKKLYSKSQYHTIKKMLRVMKMTQRGEKGGMGVVIKLVQGAAAGNMVLKGEFDSKSAAVIVGPEMFARLMLNPMGAKLLIEGFSLPRGHRLIAPTAVKLTNLINKMYKRQDQIGEMEKRNARAGN